MDKASTAKGFEEIPSLELSLQASDLIFFEYKNGCDLLSFFEYMIFATTCAVFGVSANLL